MKKMIANLCISLIGLMLVLAALEGFLRVTHLFGARISWSVPDPVLGWRMEPSKKHWAAEENSRRIPWQTNRFGYRDKDWTVRKPEGTFRIAVLGDSYVEALQVVSDQTFLALTEKKLSAVLRERPELMNFGRSAFTQTEELWILQNEVLQFSPDMVVVFFFPVNDIYEIAPETSLDRIRPYYRLEAGNLILDTSFNQTRTYRLKCLVNPLKHRSVLLSLLTERFTVLRRQIDLENKVKLQEKNALEPTLTLEGYLSLCTQNPDPLYVRNYALNKRLLAEMAAFLRPKGIPLLLVSIDLPSYLPGTEEKWLALDPAFDSLFFEKDLAAFSKSEGIEFLGLQNSFREAYSKNHESLHWQKYEQNIPGKRMETGGHTGHWNDAGHRVVAEALSEKLEFLLTKSNP
ncbi:MAG: SGNH/GDSL hydrolase family protein [Candidatus Omnitrophota bacterium]